MAAPAAAAQQATHPARQEGAQAGQLPFEYGSNQYREAPFVTNTQTLDGNPHDIVANVTPGGFLRGVTIQVTSVNGVLGTSAALVADSPFSIFSSITLEDISGGPILYPMGGYAYGLIQKYSRPWTGDASKRSDFSNTINPAFTLRLFAEVKDTLGVLANTDARAQYRIRLTIAPLVQTGPNGLVTVGTGVTAPAVTTNIYLETWAQPDLNDLIGNPISQIPDGRVALQHARGPRGDLGFERDAIHAHRQRGPEPHPRPAQRHRGGTADQPHRRERRRARLPPRQPPALEDEAVATHRGNAGLLRPARRRHVDARGGRLLHPEIPSRSGRGLLAADGRADPSSA